MLGTLLGALGSLAWLAIPWAIGEIITFASDYQPGGPTRWLWLCLAVIAGVSLVHYAGQELGRYLIYLIAEQASVALQQQTLRHLTRLNLAWHEQADSGSKLKQIGRGGDSLNQLIRLYINIGVDTLISLVAILAIFWVLDGALMALLLAFFGIHYLLAALLTGRAVAQSQQVNRGEEAFYGIKFELLNNITTVKTLGMVTEVMELVQYKTRPLLADVRRRIVLFRTRLAILGLNQQLFRLVLIGFAAWQVVQGHYETGIIAQVYFYFGKMEAAAKRFSDIYHDLIMIRVNLQGVQEILRQPPDIEDEGDQNFPADWQTLRLHGLHFAYGTREVLRGLDLAVRRGEKIGIAGLSGAGKSTLFKLLQKLYGTYSGAIAFDTTPLRAIRREDYTRHIGVVLQDTELFNLSLRDNITLGRELDADGEALLRRVVALACLDEWLDGRPAGLDTMIGEKGLRLSGGEKQRIGIARALFRQPHLLFLDEATSHLDARTEAQIQDGLRQEMQDITAFVIAHRLATLRHLDRILVLADGRIAESGTFDELIARQGLFYTLWLQQGG